MRYYLAVVVEGEGEVVVVFPVSEWVLTMDVGVWGRGVYLWGNTEADDGFVMQNLLPGRAIVEEVWRGARECLYEPKE